MSSFAVGNVNNKALSHVPREMIKKKKKTKKSGPESTITGHAKTSRAKLPPDINLSVNERLARRDKSVLHSMLDKDQALSRFGNHESYMGYLDQLDREALENWRNNVNYLNKVNGLHLSEDQEI